MEFLKGKKEEFIDFLDSISINDKIAILTHTDLDGIASGILLEEILKSKGLKANLIEFLDYKTDLLKNLLPKLNEEKVTRIFVSDISIDDLALNDFEKLRKEIPTFLIDHHPINPSLKNFKNIIKAKSEDCAAWVIYNLGDGLIDKKKWQEFVCETMISEFSYNSEDNLRFIKKIFPGITKENILFSTPAEIYKLMSSAIIFYDDKLRDAYDLICKRDIVSLKKYNSLIQKEVEEKISDFWKKAEYDKKEDLYFYYFEPKYSVKAIIANELSIKKPDSSFILVVPEKDNPEFLNVSARNQSKKKDMNLLLKKAIFGLKDANAGGHIPAAGASFRKVDLEKFKENLL